MTHVEMAQGTQEPEAWVFAVSNTCRECGTRWKLDRQDQPATWWRSLTGILPMPKAEVRGPGIVTTSMYLVKHFTAEMGINGTYLTTRCPNCGTYAMTGEWRARLQNLEAN